MFEAVEGLVAEHRELETRLADPAIHSDQGLARRLNQRYAELTAIVRAYAEWQQLGDDIGAARELASEDESFTEEAETLTQRRAVTEERLRHLLVPRDAADSKDAIVEIKSGRAARSRPCSPATCCACTPATPSGAGGRPSSSTPPSPTSGASSR